jgi:two-component system, OmpR family, aerobic respiration control sensor histidine kinase ArcB
MEDRFRFDEKFNLLCNRMDGILDVVSQLPVHIYWKDIDGRYAGSNKNQLNTFGVEPHDLLGNSVVSMFNSADIDHDKDAQWCHKISDHDKAVLLKDTPVTVTEEVFFKGQKQTYLSRKHVLRNDSGSVVGLSGVSIDITNWQKINDTKKSEIQQKQQAEFLMNVAHDLRTSCHGLLGFAKILYEEEEDQTKQEKLKLLLDSSGKLYHWIDQALDYMRYSTNLEEIHKEKKIECLPQLINQVITLFLPLIRKKQINLIEYIDPDLPQNLIFNGYVVRRVIVHLMENAIKFTHESGMVSIHVSCVSKNNGSADIAISIKDTGAGILKEHQQNIFKPFTRLNSSYKGNYQGMGMGLSVVDSLVKQLKGSIDVNSIVGQGSEFYLQLNFELATTQYQKQEDEPKCNISTLPFKQDQQISRSINFNKAMKKVLVVEDELICQRIAVCLLERYGCEVEVASNASEATSLVMKFRFDFILMDIGLPDLSGVELVKVIRSLREYHDVPIVALTAHLDISERNEAGAAGFDDILIKPLKTNAIDHYFAEEKAMN